MFIDEEEVTVQIIEKINEFKMAVTDEMCF
jgi:hypothetical protein